MLDFLFEGGGLPMMLKRPRSLFWVFLTNGLRVGYCLGPMVLAITWNTLMIWVSSELPPARFSTRIQPDLGKRLAHLTPGPSVRSLLHDYLNQGLSSKTFETSLGDSQRWLGLGVGNVCMGGEVLSIMSPPEEAELQTWEAADSAEALCSRWWNSILLGRPLPWLIFLGWSCEQILATSLPIGSPIFLPSLKGREE